MIEVRDTKDHGAGATLRFTPDELASWIDGASKGEFNHLIRPDKNTSAPDSGRGRCIFH